MGCNASQDLHIIAEADDQNGSNRGCKRGVNSSYLGSKNDGEANTTMRTRSSSTIHSTVSSFEGDDQSPRSPYFDFSEASDHTDAAFSERRRVESGRCERNTAVGCGIDEDKNRDAGTTVYSNSNQLECSPSSAAAAAIDFEFNDSMTLAELSHLLPLANGGFCVVCSCVYRGRRAVLKVPRPNGPPGAVEDLLLEIAIYKRISAVGGHSNVARAFGSGFHLQQGQQSPFLVLELIEGGTLAQALERSRLPQGHDCSDDPIQRLHLALEIAQALTFLHNDAVPGGFVLHRDLKPANIGLTLDGHVKVFDLGLSVLRESRGAMTDKYQMSGMAGSKRFMAPEVCHGTPYNEKIDVYSFSIVCWELYALHKPFAGMSVTEHFREVTEGGLRPQLNPTWPEPLRNLLEACWQVDPDLRPSIVEVRDTLRAIIMPC